MRNNNQSWGSVKCLDDISNESDNLDRFPLVERIEDQVNDDD